MGVSASQLCELEEKSRCGTACSAYLGREEHRSRYNEGYYKNYLSCNNLSKRSCQPCEEQAGKSQI